MKSLLKAVERDESRGVIETLMKVGISNDDDSSLKAMPFGPNVEETEAFYLLKIAFLVLNWRIQPICVNRAKVGWFAHTRPYFHPSMGKLMGELLAGKTR